MRNHARSMRAKHHIRVIAQFTFDDSVTRAAMSRCVMQRAVT
jgi:hypothetical protein